ncbi:hypothetical protein [Pseudomonas putida]|uniref:hypothetical protein n=1 Tax=Pseudomonas putida TaxID=303 RepID=UPI003906A51F
MDETLSYLKDRFKDEQDRFNQVENKSAKFFTAVSILIAGLSAMAGLKNGLIFEIHSPLAFLTFVSFSVAALAIGCAWGHALSALRVKDYPNLPSNRPTGDYLLAVSEEMQKRHLFNCYIDTLESLKATTAEKTRPLDLAYQEIMIGAGAFATLAILIIIRELTS